MDRKETTGLNPMLSLRQQIEEKSEGLCNIGPGPGGIGVSNPPGSEVYMLLMFEPKPVQDGVVFPESVDGYSVRIAGRDRPGADKEGTGTAVERRSKSHNTENRGYHSCVIRTTVHFHGRMCECL